MIKVTLEFSSVSETVAALNRLAEFPMSAEAAPPEAATVPLQAPAARRGRPPKAAAPAIAPEQGLPPVAAPEAAPAAAAPSASAPVEAAMKLPNQPVQVMANATAPLTADELRPLLKAVLDAKGAKVATDILKLFKVNRISDVKPEDSRTFAAACAQAVK